MNFEFKSSAEDADEHLEAGRGRGRGRAEGTSRTAIAEFGDGSSAREVEGQFSKDLGKAGLLSLPVTLIILLIAFGALFAAGIPLLLALTSVIATMFLIAVPSHLMPVDAQVKEVILLIGLAVGVDYSLFYLKREREERCRGSQRVGSTRGRSGDLGALGPDLRPHRHDRDGGDVLRRRSRVLVVRARNDHGRRDRDARDR